MRLEGEASSKELLDQIFRALHTIKGAASFLNLPEVTRFAHAAEDALNQLRKGAVSVNALVIDALLRSVDTLRGQLAEVADGSAVTPGPEALIEVLHGIAAGVTETKRDGAPASGGASGEANAPAKAPLGGTRRALTLPPEKTEIVAHMEDELSLASEMLAQVAEQVNSDGGRAGAMETLAQMLAGLRPTADYFGLPGLLEVLRVVDALSAKATEATGEQLDALADRFDAVRAVFDEFGAALKGGEEIVWTGAELESRLMNLGVGRAAPGAAAPGEGEEHEEPDGAGTNPASGAKREGAGAAAQGEQTVRVEVARLEALLNLVGEMVLTKNQILGLSRQLRQHGLPHEVQEQLNGATGNLDRLTSELQVGVMRTRMQPLSKLFGRYPRIVRDLARQTDKQIGVEIVGGETEVDKSVLEALADPMVHILRNSADHGIETPDARRGAGKDPNGTIRIRAEHQGGHVRVEITDDGKGIDPEVIGPKAVEKGLITPEQLAQMTPSEVVNLVFAAGFSTAAKVSDLSGRGVGMDVVRTNINKLGGSINLSSVKGRGTTIEVLIPLTVAIMPAMMVGVGRQEYAVPVACIVEIVRLHESSSYSVGGKPVIRLRESVLPLIDLRDRLSESRPENDDRKFAVVVEVGQQRAGLVVDHLIGQQEVVIKPLDDAYTTGGPFSGATIREDGDVSLIIDAVALLRGVRGSDGA